MDEPLAGLTLEQVRVIMEKLLKEFIQQSVVKEYVNSVGISRVDTRALAPCPIGEENNYCIVVGLLRPLPEFAAFPEQYEGVRVYVQLNGPIYAAKQKP